MSSFNLTAMQVTASLRRLVWYAFSNLISSAARLPTLLQLSNDDHSYFVRWKLPTDTLEVFDDNKWLRLSSSALTYSAVVDMGLDCLTD